MNIGCVIYNKNFDSGKLFANWHFAANNKVISGTGEAIGSRGPNYEGEYSIIYQNSNGLKSSTLDLIIKNEGGYFLLEWYQNNLLKSSGIGMLKDGSLVVGWKDIL